jgi:LCP family protein required for cell wall assembly
VVDRSPRRDERKVHIPAPDDNVGASRPAARPTPSVAAASRPGTSVFDAPAHPRPQERPPASPPRRPPSSRPAPTPAKKAPRRPKLRRILRITALLLPALIVLALVGGYLYAKSVYDKIEKIPLADVLGDGGSGTNYLIVGSDSRDVEDLVDAGLDPAGFADGGGQRSDTMLVLRFVDGKAMMMSIPRDLYMPIAETGGSQKINAAYNGGPRRLILTVQQSLGIPVDHYLEVDFVSFAKLVDSLGGITIDFPNPAFDRSSGLDVQQAGAVELDGPQALGFVRSRHYVEIIGGEEVPDATGDLGRVQRQQQFLKAVFSELGSAKNPITLARAAGSAAGGLRIDDTMSLWDAIQFAWRLRSLDPTPVELPTRLGSNEAGSVLFLEPGADAAIAQFQ